MTDPDTSITWSAIERHRFSTALAKTGFAQSEIEAWLAVRPLYDPAHQSELVREWRRHGFDATTAIEWYDAAWSPDEAQPWAAAGYSAEEAECVRMSLILRHVSGVPLTELKEAAWRRSELPPSFVCLALRAGIHSVAEATSHYERAKEDRDAVLGQLRLLAGLLELG